MGMKTSSTWLMALLITACSNPDPDTPPTPELQAQEAAITAKYIAEAEQRNAEITRLAPVRDAIVKHFESAGEPTVKAARWTQDDILKVGVLDNGENRNGLAQYVCGTLNQNGITYEVLVQVIDIQKLANDDDVVKLGEYSCPPLSNEQPIEVTFPAT